MKRFATKTFVMTAVLAACAIGASAQSMKAEIPFTFRAGGAVLAAGTYRIDAGNTVVRVTNSDTRKGVVVMSQYKRDLDKNAAAGAPKLWFSCAGSSCVLTSLYNGVGASAMVVGAPPSAGKEMAEIRVVNLTVVKTE